MDIKPRLALVLPCYNPPPNWASNLITSLLRLQQMLPPDTAIHVYLVDDGADRGVVPADIELLRATLPHFTYLSYPTNRGKGHALRTGVARVAEELCLFTDIDFPYEETSVAAIYNTLRSGDCELAVGTRDEVYYTHVPAARRRVSNLLRGLTRTLLRLPISDTQCGLKGFNARGRELFLRTTTDRYLFDLELLFLAVHEAHFRVQAVPVVLKPGVVFSTLNPRILFTEGFSFLRILRRRLF